jgi:branched-chain amino acid transport system permease protein
MGVATMIYMAQAVHGIVYGMLIFLVASGLSIVFGMMGVLNITHCAFYMLGAYLAYSIIVYSGSFWLGLLISPLLVGFLGIVIERSLIRKVHIRGHLPELLLTFGLFFIIAELVLIIWGSVPLSVPVPKIFEGEVTFFEANFPIYRLFIIGFSCLVLIAMVILLLGTRIGIIIRAAVSDPVMVEALGINISSIFMWVFGGGAALAGMAGVIAAPLLSTYPGMGFEILMDCFVVIVVGGFGSIFGAFIASLMIGQLQAFGILWIPKLALIFQFLLMVIVLILRPTGLFGEKA